jgi:superfamily II DNA/RNA helicase
MLWGMNRDDICSAFLDRLSFELYPFQEEALLAWFEAEGGILVSAPTGMGKTLIAEAAIFEALTAGQRLYYTTPLIALTDQKFREFQDKAEEWGFERDDIGLITGNRLVNPEARVRVVVAEILLNHLLGEPERCDDVSAVVMDEFHNFNDFERGIVWELSLVLLPEHVRVMLLSATVGNAVEFLGWLREKHGKKLRLVQTDERRVPLEYEWVGEKLLTEHLPGMVTADDETCRSPALVFCFNRDECWDVAERLKGVKLIDQATRAKIEERLESADLTEGAGPKLRNILIRGVGVHHAGILPKHKEVVEDLFLAKLIPFVICTETLAAGINLPARSVVISTLLKGKPRERKLVASSSAHQMFGRAGRPQFDKKGYVYAVAHDDDVKIEKWRKKYEQIDPNSKDPGILRMRKQLEKKKPTRRKTEQYWTEGQFQSLIKAGPGKLYSRSMIPYQVLIYLLTRSGSVKEVRDFLSKRFNSPKKIEAFQDQLDHMIGNLQTFGYLARAEGDEHVTLDDSIHELLTFRSVDPVYGAFLCRELNYANLDEKIQALESVLQMPFPIARRLKLEDVPPGPLQKQRLEPMMISMGVKLAEPEQDEDEAPPSTGLFWDDVEEEERPPTFPEMLKILYDNKLETPEDIWVQPKWAAGGLFEMDCDFFKFVKARDLIKNEGLVLRHLLRLVILAGEFFTKTQDPEYQEVAEKATKTSMRVDPRYSEKFLTQAEEAKKLTAF